MSNPKVYKGISPKSNFVVLDPRGQRLDPCFELANHSWAFGWGYRGNAPLQLSLALLADALTNKNTALDLYYDFREEVISQIPMDKEWELTRKEILDWVIAKKFKIKE